MITKKTRKKTWEEKVSEVRDAYERCRGIAAFSRIFYQNLFFLNPKIEDYFKDTDWELQRKAFHNGLENLVEFIKGDQDHFRDQVKRIAISHSKKGLNIHPHDYYYWIDALVMTFKDLDSGWHDDLEYYIRECVFFPVSFIISLYHQ